MRARVTRRPAVLPSLNPQQQRGEGANNFGYGARPGASPSIFAVLRRGARPGKKPYPCRNHDAAGLVVVRAVEDMTRDELRAMCKALGLSGYGKMNKAQLLEAVTK